MAVESWGIGKPDYYKSTISSRPVLIDVEDTQERVIISKSYTIAAGAVVIDTIYTVPSGYKLSFGGGFISVKDSCINKLRLVADSEELIGNFLYDMQGDFSLSSLTGQEIDAGDGIVAYIYNNDSISSIFSLLVSGVLNKSE